jgi:hypothetical protein
MHRYRVSVEVMADCEAEAASVAAKLLATFPSNATVKFLTTAAYLESMTTKVADEATESNLPKLSDLMGLCEDSPIDIGGGWEAADDEAETK